MSGRIMEIGPVPRKEFREKYSAPVDWIQGFLKNEGRRAVWLPSGLKVEVLESAGKADKVELARIREPIVEDVLNDQEVFFLRMPPEDGQASKSWFIESTGSKSVQANLIRGLRVELVYFPERPAPSPTGDRFPVVHGRLTLSAPGIDPLEVDVVFQWRDRSGDPYFQENKDYRLLPRMSVANGANQVSVAPHALSWWLIDDPDTPGLGPLRRGLQAGEITPGSIQVRPAANWERVCELLNRGRFDAGATHSAVLTVREKTGLEVALEFEKVIYDAGEPVEAVVVARGMVGIESTLSGTSTTVDADGRTPARLGTAGRSGFYFAKAVQGTSVAEVAYCLGDDGAGRLIVMPTPILRANPFEGDFFDRFLRGLETDDIATKAATGALGDWLLGNTVSAFIPTAVACATPLGLGCIVAVGQQLADFIASFLLRALDLVHQKGFITDDERLNFRSIFQGTNAVFQVATAGLSRKVLDVGLAALSNAPALIVENQGVVLFLKFGSDEVTKAMLIWARLKPK